MFLVKDFVKAALSADKAKGKAFATLLAFYREAAPNEEAAKKARTEAHDSIMAATATDRLKDSVPGATAQVYSSLIIGYMLRTGAWPDADATASSVKAPRKPRGKKEEGKEAEGKGPNGIEVQSVADAFGLAFSAAISEVLNRAAVLKKKKDEAGLNTLADRLTAAARAE